MDRSRIQLGEKLYQSPFKESSSVYIATIDHEDFVVKRRTESMEHERRILQSLDYPFFPQVKSYFQQDDIYNLVLEKKPGIPLSQMINLTTDWKSEKISIPEGIKIIRELALGLIALRNSGYYYRDFNLAHILIDDRAIVIVDHEADVNIDANGGAIVDSYTGTWETMAPEEFIVGGKMTQATTTYSLAIILHQLTHGSSLFRLPHVEGATVDAMREMSKESHYTTPDVENFTHHQHLFMKALQADPLRRHQTLEEFLSDIN
jgi:serine/threonine protein kinase